MIADGFPFLAEKLVIGELFTLLRKVIYVSNQWGQKRMCKYKKSINAFKIKIYNSLIKLTSKRAQSDCLYLHLSLGLWHKALKPQHNILLLPIDENTWNIRVGAKNSEDAISWLICSLPKEILVRAILTESKAQEICLWMHGRQGGRQGAASSAATAEQPPEGSARPHEVVRQDATAAGSYLTVMHTFLQTTTVIKR